MTIQKYSRKIIRGTLIYIAVLVVVSVLFGFADVFVQNQVYLGQMQSSNDTYAVLLGLETLRRYRPAVYFFIWVAFAGFVVRETHKYNKQIKGETNK